MSYQPDGKMAQVFWPILYMRTVQRTTADKSVHCNNDRIVYAFQQVVSNENEENESDRDSDSAVDNESGSESECDK
jgi:hypothetical protein